MFITATIPITVTGTPTQVGTSCTPMNGNVNRVHPDAEPGRDRRASTWPPSFCHQRQAAEVVDRADRRRHGGAEQDAAQLAAERQERERRDEDAEEQREPAEPRDARAFPLALRPASTRRR